MQDNQMEVYHFKYSNLLLLQISKAYLLSTDHLFALVHRSAIDLTSHMEPFVVIEKSMAVITDTFEEQILLTTCLKQVRIIESIMCNICNL